MLTMRSLGNAAMRFRWFLSGLSLILAGCERAPVAADDDLATLDRTLAAAHSPQAPDPAVLAALNDPIMVDPQLTARSNADALRPTSMPYAVPVPHPGIAAGSSEGDLDLPSAPAPEPLDDATRYRGMTLTALAQATTTARGRTCAGRLAYSADWSARMIADVPLHPDARVIEAAGADTGGCSVRAIRFYVARPASYLVDWYAYRGKQAGQRVEHHADKAIHSLSGSRGNAAWFAVFTDRGDGGTEVDLIATG
jgi:hypothetical protein